MKQVSSGEESQVTGSTGKQVIAEQEGAAGCGREMNGWETKSEPSGGQDKSGNECV